MKQRVTRVIVLLSSELPAKNSIFSYFTHTHNPKKKMMELMVVITGGEKVDQWDKNNWAEGKLSSK